MLIYLILNTINGKKYIGLTERELSVRWKEHIRIARSGKGKYLHSAMRKYGFDAFNIRALYSSTTRDELDWLERVAISQFKTTNSLYGYNLTDGGDSSRPTEAICKKISEAKKGCIFSIEHRQKLSEAKYGTKNALGHICSAEARQKIREGNLGKKHSEERRRKQSEARCGKPTGRKGLPWTEKRWAAYHQGLQNARLQ